MNTVKSKITVEKDFQESFEDYYRNNKDLRKCIEDLKVWMLSKNRNIALSLNVVCFSGECDELSWCTNVFEYGKTAKNLREKFNVLSSEIFKKFFRKKELAEKDKKIAEKNEKLTQLNIDNQKRTFIGKKYLDGTLFVCSEHPNGYEDCCECDKERPCDEFLEDKKI